MEIWNNHSNSGEKIYIELMEALCGQDTLSQSAMDSILSFYQGDFRQKFIDTDEFVLFPKFRTYTEFRNLNGVFMIGNQIEHEDEVARVSILDGDRNKLTSTLNNPGYLADTVSYTGDTSIIIREDWEPPYTGCCPKENSGEILYDNDNKKLGTAYEWGEASTWQLINNELFGTPILSWRMTHWSYKKKWTGWVCHRRHWKFNSKIKWTAKYQNLYQEDTDWIVEDNEWTCRVRSQSPYTFRKDEVGPYETKPVPFVCAYKITQTTQIFEYLSNPPEQTLIIECDNEIPPVCDICPDDFGHSNYYYDGANCYVGQVPAGFKGFVYNGCYYTHPNCS